MTNSKYLIVGWSEFTTLNPLGIGICNEQVLDYFDTLSEAQEAVNNLAKAGWEDIKIYQYFDTNKATIPQFIITELSDNNDELKEFHCPSYKEVIAFANKLYFDFSDDDDNTHYFDEAETDLGEVKEWLLDYDIIVTKVY